MGIDGIDRKRVSSLEESGAYDLDFVKLHRFRMKHRDILHFLVSFSFLIRLTLEIEIRLICFRSLHFHGTAINIAVLASDPTHLFPWRCLGTFLDFGGKFVGKHIESELSDESLGRGVVYSEHRSALDIQKFYLFDGHMFFIDFPEEAEFVLKRYLGVLCPNRIVAFPHEIESTWLFNYIPTRN
jgi:hypothetical protein